MMNIINPMLRLPLYYIFFMGICSSSLLAQQELSLHFMRQVVQSGETNPAMMSPYEINIGLPSFYGNFYNAGFPLKDMFRESGDKLFLEPEAAIESLDETGNVLQTNANLGTFSAAFTVKDFQIKLFHNTNVDAFAEYPKKLLELLWYGNERFIGESIEVAPKLDVFGYHEYGVGFAVQLNEQWSLGTHLKYLNGIAAIQTERSEAYLFTDPDIYQISAETNMLIYSSGLSDFLVSDDDDLGKEDFFAYDGTGSYFFNRNSGFAIDLGVEGKISEQLTIAASLLDLGSIKWRESSLSQSSQGDFSFDGVTVHPFEEGDDFDFSEVQDSVGKLVEFEAEEIERFKTSLPKRIYLSTNWHLQNDITLGALFYGQWYRSNFNPAFAFNVQKDFKHFLSVGAIAGVRNNGAGNFGVNLMARLAGIQIYAATDNLIPVFNPLIGRQWNFRVGLNLALKPKESKKTIDESIAVTEGPAILEEDMFLPTPPSVEEEKIETEEPQTSIPATENQATVKTPNALPVKEDLRKKKEYYRRTDRF